MRENRSAWEDGDRAHRDPGSSVPSDARERRSLYKAMRTGPEPWAAATAQRARGYGEQARALRLRIDPRQGIEDLRGARSRGESPAPLLPRAPTVPVMPPLPVRLLVQSIESLRHARGRGRVRRRSSGSGRGDTAGIAAHARPARHLSDLWCSVMTTPWERPAFAAVYRRSERRRSPVPVFSSGVGLRYWAPVLSSGIWIRPIILPASGFTARQDPGPASSRV